MSKLSGFVTTVSTPEFTGWDFARCSRAEGRYRLMPGITASLADSGTPFSILTKGTLLRRDLPLLAEALQPVIVDVALTIAVHRLEPGRIDPQAAVPRSPAARSLVAEELPLSRATLF